MKYWITWLKSKLRDWDVTKKGLIILTASSKNLKTTARIKTTQEKKARERKSKVDKKERSCVSLSVIYLYLLQKQSSGGVL